MKMRHALATIASMTLLQACSPAPGPLTSDAGDKAFSTYCATSFSEYGGRLIVDSDLCGDCFVTDPEAAIDGDPSTYASFLLGAGLDSTVSIRAEAAEGVEIAAPRGSQLENGEYSSLSASYSWRANLYQKLSEQFATYLRGELLHAVTYVDERDALDPDTGVLHRLVVTSTSGHERFDAFEIALHFENFAGYEIRIHEICPDQRTRFD